MPEVSRRPDRAPARPAVLVACTATSREGPAGTVAQAGVNRAYLDALSAQGLVPLLVPAGSPPAAALLDLADGLLLPGGVDIVPERYGQTAHPTTETDREIDQLELDLLGSALADDVPVLAICRGLQALNVALGGSLVQDLASQHPTEVDHRPDRGRTHLAHRMRVADGSRLAAALGVDDVAVNSLHHQGIARVAEGLRAVGWAEDELVEAVEMPDRAFVVGLQCHPEELWRSSHPLAGLFAAFADAVRARARSRGAVAGAAPGPR